MLEITKKTGLAKATQTKSRGGRKARLVKPAKTAARKNDVIVVTIPSVHVPPENLQAPKKINIGQVVGQNFSVPMAGITNVDVIYNVEVRKSSGGFWKLEKTFQDFHLLHQHIKTRFPGFSRMITSFPKKRIFAPSINSPQIEFRKKFFQGYLQALLQLKPRLLFVTEFLEVRLHGSKEEAVSMKDLSIDDFELLKLLGKGSFGKVFLVRVIGSTDLYAMKVLKKSEVRRRRQVEHTKTELRVMGGAQHPFICCLQFAFSTEKRLFMVSDFCQGGELFFHLKEMRCFTPEMVRFYSAEIALALEYLHTRNIIYRDIKPENVLLDGEGHIKITDFGLSRDNVIGEDATTFCGTPEYLSPEMLIGKQKGHGYGKSVDWWGLGILMYEMFYGWPPFYDKNRREMCRKILRQPLKFNSKLNRISDEAKDVIGGFLEKKPERRLGLRGREFEEIRCHPFFNTLDWELLYARKLDPPFRPNLSETTNNFDAEFTEQSARISAHEAKQNGEQEEEEANDIFGDFTFAREANADAFWD